MNLYINKEKVNKCSKGISLWNFYRNFLLEKKIDFFITFYISYKSGIKSFLK